MSTEAERVARELWRSTESECSGPCPPSCRGEEQCEKDIRLTIDALLNYGKAQRQAALRDVRKDLCGLRGYDGPEDVGELVPYSGVMGVLAKHLRALRTPESEEL